MKKANIYIIPSSFSYFCATEAKAKFGQECTNILIITYDSQRTYNNDKQVENIIDHDLWDEVLHIYPHKNSLLTHFQEIAITKKIKNHYIASNIFAADWDSFFFHLLICSLNPLHAYFIDEGASTLWVYEQLLTTQNQQLFAPRQKSLLTRALVATTGLQFKRNSHLKMFTFFNLESIPNVIEIETHNLSIFKKDTNPPLQKKSLLILGSPEFSEYYIQKLVEIKNRFEPEKIIYTPHRKEKKNTIEKIQSTLKCQIDKRPLPVEAKLLEYHFQPEHIVGFFSTALASIAIICPNSKLYNSSPHSSYESNISGAFKTFFLKYEQC
jgi:hypothetical protein